MGDYWVLNTKTKKYESSRSEPLSVFPTIVNAKDRIVFCHRWEYIIRFKNDVLITQCGQPYIGLIVQNGAYLNYGFEMSKIRDSLCDELTEQILNEMGEHYKKQFGLKPTVASKIRGLTHRLPKMRCSKVSA